MGAKPGRPRQILQCSIRVTHVEIATPAATIRSRPLIPEHGTNSREIGGNCYLRDEKNRIRWACESGRGPCRKGKSEPAHSKVAGVHAYYYTKATWSQPLS